MNLSLPLLLCQCAILSVSFEGIVCLVIFDFVIDNFSTADIYSHVHFEGNNRHGAFILRKSSCYTAQGGRQCEVRVPDIVSHTLKQEENSPKIASFSVLGVSADYNIKFRTAKEADLFVQKKAVPTSFTTLWGRIYSNWRPVIMAYDCLDDGDIGFKLLDNHGNYPDIDDRLEKLPYLFKRSDIQREIRTRHPHYLYLRNATNMEDYEIMFQSIENLRTFLELFPWRKYDDHKTQAYYFMPYNREIQNRDNSE